jgi:hypothetical protein
MGRAIDVWQRHWGLVRDPFAGSDSPYVPLPSHDEALARLVHSIEQARRVVTFRAEAGLGKTTVLRRSIAESRTPSRRFVVIGSPPDGTQLLGLLADRLGPPLGREPSRHSAWISLRRAVQAASFQGLHLVLAIDGWDEPLDAAARNDLVALAHLGLEPETRLTILRVSRALPGSHADPVEPWTLAIGLQRLTRSQGESYLQAKLSAAGCAGPIFTAHAFTRLHVWSGGVPRGLEQLAMLCLISGAARGLEVIPPDVVDGVAEACCSVEARTWGRWNGNGVRP